MFLKQKILAFILLKMENNKQIEMENQICAHFYRSVQERAQTIDELATRALQEQNKKLYQKYSNIQNTIKILKNLILQFNRKADKLEKSLIASKMINQIRLRDQYYQNRVKQCLIQSDVLRARLHDKNQSLTTLQKQLVVLRSKLMSCKTYNIKKIVQIEKLEEHIRKEEVKDNYHAKKDFYHHKKNKQRQMITSKNLEIPHEDLHRDNENIEIKLFEKIDQITQTQKLIEDSYHLLLQKLSKNEKKSTEFGLSGSLLFKLQTLSEKKSYNHIKRSNLRKHDSKLMIYDVLKGRYDRTINNQKRNQESQIYVTEKEFLNFSPLQIVGIIQLKGGLQKLKQFKNIVNQDE